MWAESLAAFQVPVAVPQPSDLALRYYRTGNVLWVVDTLVSLLLPALVLVTGWSARLREWAGRAARNRPRPTLLLYVVVFVVGVSLATLPLSFYESFLREHAYGLSNQTIGRWLGDTAKGLVVACLVAPLVALVPYGLLRRSPRRWWVWSTAAALPLMAFGFLVTPLWIDPLFNRYTPLGDRTLESRIVNEARRAGVVGARVLEVDKSVDTKALGAYVTGFGASQRIVLYDTMLRKLDPDEILFVVGHELGHYVLGHVLLGLLASWLTIGASLFAIDRIAGSVVARHGRRFGVAGLADPASLPLLLLVANVIALVATPLLLAGSRHVEHEADRFGLELTRNNPAAATAFVKLQVENLSVPRPGWLYTVWRPSHPSLAERVGFANTYHPWKTGQPLVYGDRFAAE